MTTSNTNTGRKGNAANTSKAAEIESFDFTALPEPIKKANVITLKKEAGTVINLDVRSFGSCFSATRRNKTEVQAAIEEQHKKSPLCKATLHRILNAGDMRFLRHFQTDSEKARAMWTGSQMLTLLFRAASMKKDVIAQRNAYLAANPQV